MYKCTLSTHNYSGTDEGPRVDEEIVPAPIDEKHNSTQDDSHQSILHQDAFDLVLHKEPNSLQNTVHTYVRTYVCMYVCMYVHMYVCMYVRTYVCMYGWMDVQQKDEKYANFDYTVVSWSTQSTSM